MLRNFSVYGVFYAEVVDIRTICDGECDGAHTEDCFAARIEIPIDADCGSYVVTSRWDGCDCVVDLPEGFATRRERIQLDYDVAAAFRREIAKAEQAAAKFGTHPEASARTA